VNYLEFKERFCELSWNSQNKKEVTLHDQNTTKKEQIATNINSVRGVASDITATANEKHRYGLQYELILDLISEKLDFISVSISD
jgi:hypothetical protein